ncbi:MAG TPA: ProQ/FINO family protein [Burkholderiaceae bacterium]|nr:ProQ/FINO family protein [Burkholderiaceae bacterium]
MNTPSPAPNLAPSPDQSARILLKELQEKFDVFRDVQPLAIGIDKQLLASQPELPRKVLRIALRMHTNSLRYLKTMEKAAVRLNLDGTPADPVTEDHRNHASETLRERAQKHAAQRKLQRAAEEAQRKADAAAAQHAEKLNQLAAKFSRHGN